MNDLVNNINELLSVNGFEYNRIIKAEIFYNGRDEYVSHDSVIVSLDGAVRFSKEVVPLSSPNRKDSLSLRLSLASESNEPWFLDILFHKGTVRLSKLSIDQVR